MFWLAPWEIWLGWVCLFLPPEVRSPPPISRRGNVIYVSPAVWRSHDAGDWGPHGIARQSSLS